jgi:phage gpG-like protein
VSGSITAALRRLSAVPSRAAKRAAAEIELRWLADWRAGKDPHGRAWKPLAPATVRKRGSARPILIHTGAMIGTATVRPAGKSGLTITVAIPYSGYHQTGTSRMPARPVVPYMGLPRSWDAIVRKAVKDAYKPS